MTAMPTSASSSASGRPGSAYVWKINPNAKDTLCEVGHPRRSCKTWKGGFTSIMDLAFDPRNGTLYVYEIARKGWLAFEAGFAPGACSPRRSYSRSRATAVGASW